MKIAIVAMVIGTIMWTVCGSMSRRQTQRRIPRQEKDPNYWLRQAREELDQALYRRENKNRARNIILFLGDGMGVSTVTAGRIYKGQLAGRPGEETSLVFERFPNMGLAKTYNVDHQVSDSAATATAFLCGVKANYGTVGLDSSVTRGDCGVNYLAARNMTCILQLAQQAGMSTGIVTTSRVTHATPAPLYAKSPERMWENDAQMRHLSARDKTNCQDIASQITGPVGININVILGGGRSHLMPKSRQDPEYEKFGLREDGRDLIKEWESEVRSNGATGKFVYDLEGFNKVKASETDYLMGLFEYSHMRFSGDRQEDKLGEPSLSEMVEKAIQILSKNKNGFFLLVESARIDHGHHENTASKALEEVVSMDAAVRNALTLVNVDETLLLVTADHSHPLSIGSYATRGNPILGLTDYGDEVLRNGMSDIDGLPYTTLSYSTGPGYLTEHSRRDLTNIDTTSRTYRQRTSVPTKIVSHDGSDVAIYATGPWAHLLHRTHEQHYIYHVMAYAAALGHYRVTPEYAGHQAVPEMDFRVRGDATSPAASPGIRPEVVIVTLVWCVYTAISSLYSQFIRE